MKYQGGCHCGQVRFEAEMELDVAASCNCSICSKKGYLLAVAERLTLLQGEEGLKDYRFNTEMIAHYFCSNCGVAPFLKGKNPKTGEDSHMINLRCLDDADWEALEVRQFDGKSL